MFCSGVGSVIFAAHVEWEVMYVYREDFGQISKVVPKS